jgi:CBS domain-containing protein
MRRRLTSMRVREVMVTHVVTARKEDSVRSAVYTILNRHCGALPVVEGESQLIGIVALRDVMLPLYPNYGDYVHDRVHSANFLEMEEGYPAVLQKSVEEIMTKDPHALCPDEPVLKAASYMGLFNLRRMPVVEKGKLVGMVSISDINRGLLSLR